MAILDVTSMTLRVLGCHWYLCGQQGIRLRHSYDACLRIATPT